jgi:hypothetical protein
MKRLHNIILIATSVLVVNACGKIDNYEDPEETLTGRIIDKSTGQPIQIESGGGGVQIRYHDLTWAQQTGSPATSYREFNVKPDGSFNNTKFFEGEYKLYPFNGPFVPLYSENATAPVDNSKTVYIKGVATVDFEVEPFLKIEWLEAPTVNTDKTVTAKFKFTRGTTNPNYQFAPTDAWLIVSTTPFASFASKNNNMSNSVTWTGTAGNAFIDQPITLTSKVAFPLGSNRTYYVRIAARTNDNVQKRYNYNEVKEVLVP